MEYLTQLLTGNIGIVIIALILWKSGLLKYLIEAKNTHQENNSRIDNLEQHFNHELTDALTRIERKLEKLDDISEGIIYLKAKINGK